MRESTKYVMDKITHSLIELMRETPIGSISVCAVIDNAEVNRNSFYRHFRDKDDILRYYISSETERWLSESDVNYLTISSLQEYVIFLLKHLYASFKILEIASIGMSNSRRKQMTFKLFYSLIVILDYIYRHAFYSVLPFEYSIPTALIHNQGHGGYLSPSQ